MNKVLGMDEFKRRMFRYICLIGFLYVSFSLFQNIFVFGLNLISIFNALLLPPYGLLFFLSYNEDYKILTVPFTILLNISFGFLWFIAGGYHGTPPIVIFIIIFGISIYSSKKNMGWQILLTSIFAIAIAIIQYFVPTTVVNSVPENLRELDYLISLILLIAFFSISLKFFFNHFNYQQERLIEKRKELEEINKNQDKIYGVIAHDLRNPVSGISIGLEVVRNEIKGKVDYDIIDYFDSLSASSKQAYVILENLLNIAKLKESDIKIKKKPIDLYDVFQNEIKLLSPMIKQKSIEIINKISLGKYVKADDTILSLIVRNILTNSIKFSNENGKLEANIISDQKKYYVTVKDNGRGMKKELIKNILSNEDVNSTTGSHGEKGSGLGLQLVVDLIKKSGESIDIRSIDNQGTEITFSVEKSNNLD